MSRLLLIVEDEQVIRVLLGVALEDDGYKVLQAESGEEAIALLDKHKEARGVITDVRLGDRRKMSGWDVARHARASWDIHRPHHLKRGFARRDHRDVHHESVRSAHGGR